MGLRECKLWGPTPVAPIDLYSVFFHLLTFTPYATRLGFALRFCHLLLVSVGMEPSTCPNTVAVKVCAFLVRASPPGLFKRRASKRKAGKGKPAKHGAGLELYKGNQKLGKTASGIALSGRISMCSLPLPSPSSMSKRSPAQPAWPVLLC